MDNKIVSTTYVPLQPPFQIIKYGDQVGMQIGTFVATTQKEGDEQHPFSIETHSYPVVSYRNKEAANRNEHLFEKYFMEGTVWDRVELHQVCAICLSDSHLPWQEFIDALWSDIWYRGYYSEPDISIFYKLRDFGVKIDPIPSGTHELHLQTYCGDERPVMVRTDRDDIMCLNVDLNELNDNSMAVAILQQLTSYHFYFNMNSDSKQAGEWNLIFSTDEKMLQPLVDILNNLKDNRLMMKLDPFSDSHEKEP